MTTSWDCIVVGAGAAGLSAGLVLGRARRRTLIVDAAHQSNLPSHGIGGLLGHDGRPPAEFYATGRSELAKYPTVELRSGEVVGGERCDDGFRLVLADGSQESTRRILLASGMNYGLPELPGIAQRWGRSVFHCPFCHGWEVRDQQLGALDRGATGLHRALLLRAWSEDVTLFSDGPAELGADDVDRLRAAGVTIDERRVLELEGPGDQLTTVRFTDGDGRPCTGLQVPVLLAQRSRLAEQLGAATKEPNPMVADAVEIDAMFRTSATGVYAAGDISVTMPSAANAIAAGSNAAAMIVGSLISEANGLPPM